MMGSIMAILIIEDEKKLANILKRALKIERYSVDIAYDGTEGLAKALKNNYSLIILDIMLPRKDGLEVCRELRARGIHTPIIMLTARGSTGEPGGWVGVAGRREYCCSCLPPAGNK